MSQAPIPANEQERLAERGRHVGDGGAYESGAACRLERHRFLARPHYARARVVEGWQEVG